MFSSKHFLIFPVFLTVLWFIEKCYLFNLQVWGDVLLPLSLLSSDSTVVTNTFCIILKTLFNCIASFTTQVTVYLGEWSMRAWKECVLCSCWRVACSLNVNSSTWLPVSCSALADSADTSISYYVERSAGSSPIIVDLSAGFRSVSFCIMHFAPVIM